MSNPKTLEDASRRPIENAAVPDHLYRFIMWELEEGERLEWIDVPVPGKVMPASMREKWSGCMRLGCVAALFGAFISMCGVAILVREDAMAGLIVLAFGAALLSNFPIQVAIASRAMRKAGGIVYAVTDRRVLLFGEHAPKGVMSLHPSELNNIHALEYDDGTGSVILKPALTDWQRPDDERGMGIFGIRNTPTVFRWVRRVADSK